MPVHGDNIIRKSEFGGTIWKPEFGGRLSSSREKSSSSLVAEKRWSVGETIFSLGRVAIPNTKVCYTDLCVHTCVHISIILSNVGRAALWVGVGDSCQIPTDTK